MSRRLVTDIVNQTSVAATAHRPPPPPSGAVCGVCVCVCVGAGDHHSSDHSLVIYVRAAQPLTVVFDRVLLACKTTFLKSALTYCLGALSLLRVYSLIRLSTTVDPREI